LFYEYVVGHMLLPAKAIPPENLLLLSQHNCQWLEVPTYQRGIAWTLSEVEELLRSDSVLLGNVILGQFAVTQKPRGVLPPNVREYVVLVDGLQRLSIGTILLSLLYPRVFSSTPSWAAEAGRYTALAARCSTMAPIFQHNDRELAGHPRQAVSESYRILREAMAMYLEDMVARGDGELLARLIVNLFLHKQVAQDLYFNFTTPVEMTNTFIGLNSVRVDLSPVDLLRSHVVDRAMDSGWRQSEVEDVENTFTSVFTTRERPNQELLPLASILLEALTAGSAATHVFPSWEAGLRRDDVERLLECVRRTMEVGGSGYVQEIRATGAIPFAGMICYYYRRLIADSAKSPSFWAGGTVEDAELHPFLCANVRALLAGRIGRTREAASRLLSPSGPSLLECAEHIAETYSRGRVSQPVDRDWLRSVLRRIDQRRAPRIFNACLLPERAEGWGKQFAPDSYGVRSMQYHVDHLIPRSVIEVDEPGELEAEALVNFAPLPSNLNKVAKATSCSHKLGGGGVYETYVKGHKSPHPYCSWLAATQGSLGSDLDRQDLLEPNQKPDLVGARLDWLVERLGSRL
jgi:hypothetical protein